MGDRPIASYLSAQDSTSTDKMRKWLHPLVRLEPMMTLLEWLKETLRFLNRVAPECCYYYNCYYYELWYNHSRYHYGPSHNPHGTQFTACHDMQHVVERR
jgi:hypothetical protein